MQVFPGTKMGVTQGIGVAGFKPTIVVKEITPYGPSSSLLHQTTSLIAFLIDICMYYLKQERRSYKAKFEILFEENGQHFHNVLQRSLPQQPHKPAIRGSNVVYSCGNLVAWLCVHQVAQIFSYVFSMKVGMSHVSSKATV